MVVAISGKKLGIKQNLIYSENEFSWSVNVPEDAWLLGFESENKDLEKIADAVGVKLADFKDTSHAKSLQEVTVKNLDSIPWMHVLPSEVFKSVLEKLLGQLRMILEDASNNYYMTQFLDNRRLLMDLKKPKIDLNRLKEILDIEKDKPKYSDILKFKPDETGFAQESKYSQSSTITGRLTVKEGPGILTLKKEYRDVLDSRYSGGKIVQIDITSLEPRIALSLCTEDIPDDIYEFISQEIFSGEVSREEVKVSTLSCIYGASHWSLAKRLPKGVNAKIVLSSLRKYFGIDELESRLTSFFRDNGYIENLYGRQIKSKDTFVNHYIQSTGVDVSFNVFHNIISCLVDHKVEFAPIYVIHDAIIIDVHPDSFELLEKIARQKFAANKVGCEFPVKLEIIKE